MKTQLAKVLTTKNFKRGFIILVSILAIAYIINILRPKQDFWYEIYKDRMELKYWSSKDSLVTQVDRYIKSVAPESTVDGLYLINKCVEYNIDLKFVLAQATLESQFGTIGTAKKTNSIFNVGAYDGLSSDKISKKHKYDNPNLSIEPYLNLLINRYLDGKNELDLLEKFVDKDGKRYASYPHYEKELLNIIKKIDDTTYIDEAYNNFIKYTNLTNR